MIHLGYVNIILFKFNLKIIKGDFIGKIPLDPWKTKRTQKIYMARIGPRGPFRYFILFFSLSSDITVNLHYIQRMTFSSFSSSLLPASIVTFFFTCGGPLAHLIHYFVVFFFSFSLLPSMCWYLPCLFLSPCDTHADATSTKTNIPNISPPLPPKNG